MRAMRRGRFYKGLSANIARLAPAVRARRGAGRRGAAGQPPSPRASRSAVLRGGAGQRGTAGQSGRWAPQAFEGDRASANLFSAPC